MFYWVLGIDYSHLLRWLFGIIVAYSFIMFKIYSYNWEHAKKYSYKKCKRILNFIMIIAVILLLSIFIISKDKVYAYKPSDFNSLNYSELIERIKEESNPNNGEIYYQSSPLRATYNKNLDLTNIDLDFIIFRNNCAYSLNVYNINKSIIIHENEINIKGFEDHIKKVSFSLNDNNFISSFSKLDLTHYKTNNEVNNNNIKVTYYTTMDEYYNINLKEDFMNKIFIIEKSGNIIKITDDVKLQSNLYDFYYVYQDDNNKAVSSIFLYYIEK